MLSIEPWHVNPGYRPHHERLTTKGYRMNLLLRTLAMIALVTLVPTEHLTQGDALARGIVYPAGLTIDGDKVNRIAHSSPGSKSQIVLGQGVYIREAGGDWTRTGTAPELGSVVFAADDTDLLLSGAHPPCLRGGASTALERSENGGESWEMVEGAEGVRPLVVWRESGIALGATCAGMMLSTDAGQTWANLAAIEPGYEITAFAAISADDGKDVPVVLFGMTSEGGTSRLYRLDLNDPLSPVLSEPLREYWAIGGIAARGDTYVLAAADGVWVSEDAGQSWNRSADGLEDVVLEGDPSKVGLPVDVQPETFGLYSVAFLEDDGPALATGSADGLYTAANLTGPWSLVDGTAHRIGHLSVIPGDTCLLYSVGDTVFEASLPADDADAMGDFSRIFTHAYSLLTECNTTSDHDVLAHVTTVRSGEPSASERRLHARRPSAQHNAIGIGSARQPARPDREIQTWLTSSSGPVILLRHHAMRSWSPFPREWTSAPRCLRSSPMR